MDVVGPLVFLTQRPLVLQITVAIAAVPHLDEHQSCEGEGDELERHGCDERSPSPQLKLALLCAAAPLYLPLPTHHQPPAHSDTLGWPGCTTEEIMGRMIFMMHCTIRYPHFHDGNLFTFIYISTLSSFFKPQGSFQHYIAFLIIVLL